MPRVLVVDDEKSIRRTLEEFLRADGFEVETAKDVEAALESLAKSGFDVVLTDIVMPRFTGIELLTRLRERGSDAEIVLMTGEPSLDTAVEAVRNGAHDYLVKPVGKQQILRTVRQAAEVKALRDETMRLQETNAQYRRNLEKMVLERTESLREQERQLSTLMDNLPGMVYRSRNLPGWPFEFESEGCLELTGHPVEDFRAKQNLYGELILQEDRDRVWEEVQVAVAAGRSFELVYRLRTASGQSKWVWERGRMVEKIADVGMLEGFVTDISERIAMENALKASTARLKKTLWGIVDTMTAIVERRDPYTAGHQRRVRDLACAIADVMGLSEDRTTCLRMAATVHDLGKVAVPIEILGMPRKLTPIELELMRGHPLSGYEILKEIDFDWPVAEVVYQHHERMDGSGYPRRLAGERILPEAKILAVADVVEAMSAHRPYRPGLGIDTALQEIRVGRGVLYDPEAVDACLDLFLSRGFRLDDAGTGLSA